MIHVIGICTLNLKLGTRNEFQRLYKEARSLLQRWNFDVVTHGPSLHDENTYCVIRRFDSFASCEQMEGPTSPALTGAKVRMRRCWL
jgi:hypothetical protein